MTNWSDLVFDKELNATARSRKVNYVEKKGRSAAKDDYIDEGWEIVSTYKDPKFIKLRKAKPFDEQFEDAVWTMFHKMGFSSMNKSRLFKVSYDPKNPSLTQQIDVFAADDETVFIVECKASEKIKEATFKKDIEAFHGQMEGIMKEVRKEFDNRKFVFVWATRNIILSPKDKERLDEWNIVHFDDKVIQYYSELANHLGTSARYQLLGNVLKGKDIKNLQMDVPALECKMGAKTYYAFSIEPEKLLKIGYILHRSKANAEMMPTYQRLIKKSRLTQICKFVNEGGYFPNSIIISIDTRGKGIQFDAAGKRMDGMNSRLGVLHLPKQYHSAYIIDGQHRLYGYTDSDHASTDCIPVVAFVDLDRSEQLKMFIDINENQKAVPKTLRVTLNKDVYWDSENYNERRKALQSKIAQELGENSTSPLLGRVIMGEEERETETKCLSVGSIQTALSKCSFFNEYNKDNSVKRQGTMDSDDMDKTCDAVFKLVSACLRYFMNNCSSEWEKGNDNGVITINRGIQAIIRVLDEIVNLLIKDNKINPLKDSADYMMPEIEFYLAPLADFFNSLTEEKKKEIRQTFGTNGDTYFLRYFQKPIHDKHSDYSPDGLEEFFENQTKKYNETSRSYLLEITETVGTVVREELMSNYNSSWKKDGVPKSILKRLNEQKFEKEMESDNSVEIDDWEFATLDDFREIVMYSNNWSKIFSELIVPPEYSDLKGTKEEKVQWMSDLYSELMKLSKGTAHSVSKATFQKIESIYDWLKDKE